MTKNRINYEFGEVLKLLEKFETKGKLLDVGCAAGFFLDFARKDGFQVFGAEFSSDLAKYGQNALNLDIRIGTLKEAAYEDNSFDIVTLIGVIEHLPDGNEIMDEVARILKPGGSFIVLTENAESWVAKKLKVKWNGYMPPEHLCYYSPVSLKKVAELRGLEFVSFIPIASELRASFGGLLTNEKIKNKMKSEIDTVKVSVDKKESSVKKVYNFVNNIYMKTGIADRMICVLQKSK